MKLYTYFRAVELIHARCIYHDWVFDADTRQYVHLRDGLIARMERREMQINELKNRVDFYTERILGLENDD